MMNCIRCGQMLAEGVDVCPTCGFVQSRAEETILEWYDDGMRAEADKRYERAAELYRNAADLGYLPAQLAYGKLLEYGRGVKRDPLRAKEYYKSAAAYGEAEAALALYHMLKGEKRYAGGEEDPMYYLRVSAALGSPEGQYCLAEAARRGEVGDVSESHIAYLYAESAAAGYEDAAIRAGELCLGGSIHGANEGHARYFFEKAHTSRAAQRYLHRLKSVETLPPPDFTPKDYGAILCDLAQSAESYGDNAIAFSLYGTASDLGNVRALFRLGLCYENAVGTMRNAEEAFECYCEAADKGSIEALLQIALCYRYGRGVRQSDDLAFDYYLRAADRNNARAQYFVGECYLNGELCERDLRRAIAYFERAALQGHSDAIERVDALRSTMTEIYNAAVEAQNKGDDAEALRLYVMVAEMGHSAAQCNAGYCYQTGKGCTKDTKRALYYYRMAYEGGSLVAKYNLGICYSRGIGVKLDFDMARRYLTEAKDGGHKAAENLLLHLDAQKNKKLARYAYAASTVLYRRGEVGEALTQLVRAAKLGNARATYMLGCHFEFGDGVPCDMRRADSLYMAAATLGLDAFRCKLKDGYMRERKLLALSGREIR